MLAYYHLICGYAYYVLIWIEDQEPVLIAVHPQNKASVA